MNINIDSQIVVQTAAQWAADNTVYSAKRILVTSDASWDNTDQRKFKIADGTQTWSQLDYPPIGYETMTTSAGEFKFAKTIAGAVLLWTNGQDMRFSASVGGSPAFILKTDGTIVLENGTANKFLKTGASKEITFVDSPVDVNTIGSAINSALSATPNDTDLVMSVDTSVAKKNTWTQIKAFLKTYFDTVYATAASLSGKEDTSNKSDSYTVSSTTTYANTKALVDGLATKRSSTYETLVFTGSFSNVNFADSTTYYFGTLPSLAPQTIATVCRFGFNEDLTITKALLICSQGPNYSNEAVSVYLRKDNTTDSTITTSLDLNSVGLNAAKIFTYSLSIPVLAASYYEVKLVMPAFATNGANSRWTIQLYGY